MWITEERKRGSLLRAREWGEGRGKWKRDPCKAPRCKIITSTFVERLRNTSGRGEAGDGRDQNFCSWVCHKISENFGQSLPGEQGELSGEKPGVAPSAAFLQLQPCLLVGEGTAPGTSVAVRRSEYSYSHGKSAGEACLGCVCASLRDSSALNNVCGGF